jgi:hypothetical protein
VRRREETPHGECDRRSLAVEVVMLLALVGLAVAFIAAGPT